MPICYTVINLFMINGWKKWRGILLYVSIKKKSVCISPNFMLISLKIVSPNRVANPAYSTGHSLM